MVVKTLTGNYAVAYAVKLARVNVVSAYPITPQTTIVEKLSEMIEKGELNARMIRVESEHSALAAVYGAASAGARAFTATSSHGLLYMHEVVWWAAGSRIPLVMAVVTRAIGPPWNIHVDHQDILDQRDSGWIIAVAQENQEVLDLTLQAFKISEDPRVYLPMMVGLDGFILSHTTAPVDIPDQELVDSWLPPRRQPYIIAPESEVVMGNIAPDEDHFMMRYSMAASMEAAKKVIEEVDKEYGEIFGRSYGGLVECYKCEDAEYFVVIMGSWAGDAKKAVDTLREQNIPVGVVRIRFVRPWPREKLLEILSGAKGVLVFDRAVSMGSTGILFSEVAQTLYPLNISLKGLVAGLAGVDVGPSRIEAEILKFIKQAEEGAIYTPTEWILPEKYAGRYPSSPKEVIAK
ncbi:MAG: pyruvate ferredoxin oxidoreductase [Desulfurococcales archaeon]|nr:pyruvate ferredoxin oxidoreductase [Desulfurococcales archaeon]MCE4629460.1 pyruvate ferredoxin oxidoreductase [Desulfurococcales archaeon]